MYPALINKKPLDICIFLLSVFSKLMLQIRQRKESSPIKAIKHI